MLIIKNGTIVKSDSTFIGDIGIEGEVIVQIAEEINPNDGDTVIDASGKYVFPGFIDGHTHLEMDAGACWTADSFETGTLAAVRNGTTTVVDFATQEKGKSLREAYDVWMEKAKRASSCNYRFHMAITDWNEATKAEIASMPNLGVTSFKMYMAYANLYSDDGEILEALREIKKIDGVLGVHCENGTILDELRDCVYESGVTGPEGHPLSRPSTVEAEAINRLAYIGEIVGHPVQVVHLSSELGLNEIKSARARGVEITAETCPQYLLLDDSRYAELSFGGAKYVMSPPLRTVSDVEAILKGIVDRDIDTLATDHCSFHWSDKLRGRDDFRDIPNGGPGIEHRPQLMYTRLVSGGHIDVSHFSELMSENPAKRYGIYPQKGVLEVGSDADIVIWNPNHNSVISAETQLQNVEYTPYEGIEVNGIAEVVVLNGEVVARDGEVLVVNHGKYVFGEKVDY